MMLPFATVSFCMKFYACQMQLKVNKSQKLFFTPRTCSESCLHPYSCAASPDGHYNHLLFWAFCKEVSDVFVLTNEPVISCPDNHFTASFRIL